MTSAEVTALDTVKTILSKCVTFQSWTGAVDETAALEFIHKHETSGIKQQAYAMISFGQTSSMSRLATGNSFIRNAIVNVILYGPIGETETDAQAIESLHNKCSTIMETEFRAQALVVGFDIDSINRTDYPTLYADDERDGRGYAGGSSYEVGYIDG